MFIFCTLAIWISIEYVLEIALQFAITIIIEAHKNCLERLSNTVNQKHGKPRETCANVVNSNKNFKKWEKGTRIDHTTKHKKHQNFVTAFLCKAEWINETATKWTNWHKFWKKSFPIIGYETVLRVWFFLKHYCCDHRSKRIEPYDFTIVAEGVEMSQVCNPFRQRSHHVPVWSNKWRQNLNLNR